MIRTLSVVVLLVAASVSSGSDAQSSGSDPLPTTAEPGRAFRPGKPEELRVRFSATGEAADTYLNPWEGTLIGELTPVWYARHYTTDKGLIAYSTWTGLVGRVMSDFFTKAVNLSTLPVSPTGSGYPTFNGRIGDLTIQPLPVASPPVDASTVNGSAEKTIYPTLLVRTNFKDEKPQYNDDDWYDEILYQVAFWNAVDLRFRQVKNPKIRLRIAGIMIGSKEMGTMEKLAAGRNETLDAIGKHWYEMGKRFEDMNSQAYHIVMTMADSDMYEGQGSTIGIGKKSFCMPPSDDKLHAVGIFRDNHDFSGVLHAAYTLGSIFGLSDDTSSDDECDASNGFIMRPDGGTGPHYMEWSPCSLRNFSVVLKDVNCADEPAEFHQPGPAVQKPLPGDVLTPDELCKARGFVASCNPNADTCSNMECKKAGSSPADPAGTCETVGPAPDGTKCGAGRKCMDGSCECVTAECIYCKVESSGLGA